MADHSPDHSFMQQALDLARQGQGKVEPNPMVGCVIVRDGQVVGQGYHREFGHAHAESEALNNAKQSAQGADVYVTLEPCCHHGKTGPCTAALIQANVARVIVGCADPNPEVAGKGLAALRDAGIDVSTDVLGDQAKQLIAPFAKLITTGRPWVIAKWAMTLDGKIATHTGNSQWISGEASRGVVHQLRGRVDAILVGRGTAEADNPRLTARPSGTRVATRIVLDSLASLSTSSKLCQSSDEAPLLIAATAAASEENCQRLQDLGAELFVTAGNNRGEQLNALLDELGRRQMTNLLVEGGGEVLGTLFDLGAIDEVHAFVAPKLIGGQAAPTPIAGTGLPTMSQAIGLDQPQFEQLGDNWYVHGPIKKA
ncbi:MAG: bifunctional diaminohydroxyphosphoribosylaminopyrimidine deaminase/5-amino-6-(5-phosphoribosylamino)uracil reductase RibD [Bythopirellula sp.]